MIHGKVEINDNAIFAWQAIRQYGGPSWTSGVANYSCEVFDYNTKESTRFMVEHQPGDGATVLVRKIWAKYEEERRNLTPYDRL